MAGYESAEQADAAWEGAPIAPPMGEGNGDLIPAGTRVCAVVHDQKFKVVQSTGTMYINIPFEIVGPPAYAGKWIWHKFFITDASIPYVKRDWDLLGWKVPKISAILNADDNSLVGFGAEFLIGLEKYDKQDVDPTTGAQISIPVTKNIVKQFTAPFDPNTKPWENPPAAAAPPAAPTAPPAAAARPPSPPVAARPPVAAQAQPAAPVAPPAAAPAQPLAGGKPKWGFAKPAAPPAAPAK